MLHFTIAIFPSNESTTKAVAAIRLELSVETTIIHMGFRFVGMTNESSYMAAVTLYIHRNPTGFDIDNRFIRSMTNQSRSVQTTLDRTCHMQILNGDVFDRGERRSIIVATPVNIDIQRMTITIEHTSVWPYIHTDTISDAEVRIHDGIHIRRTIGFNHQLTELVPVVAVAQHIE